MIPIVPFSFLSFFLSFFLFFSFFVLFRHTRAPKLFLVFPFLSLNLGHLRFVAFVPVSLSLPYTLALTSPSHTLSFAFSLTLSSLSRFSFIFRHTRRARRFPSRRSPYTRPAPVLIDYDAYCMEKGCPPVDGQKGFPA